MSFLSKAFYYYDLKKEKKKRKSISVCRVDIFTTFCNTFKGGNKKGKKNENSCKKKKDNQTINMLSINYVGKILANMLYIQSNICIYF